LIRAIVDTNVWVSAMLNPAGPPRAVLDAFVSGAFTAVLPGMVLEEIRLVLGRPRIRKRTRMTDEDIAEYVRLIAERADVIETTGRTFGCRDPKDEALLEAAVVAGADVIVTRDDDLKGDGELVAKMREASVAIVTVAAFLRLLS
jgi:putative PIN family toxin of toxin-antitoxin system